MYFSYIIIYSKIYIFSLHITAHSKAKSSPDTLNRLLQTQSAVLPDSSVTSHKMLSQSFLPLNFSPSPFPSLLTYWIFPYSFMDCWASFCLTSGVQWLTLCCEGTRPWRHTKPRLNFPSSIQWRPDRAEQKPSCWTDLGHSQQRIQNMACFSNTLKELVSIKSPNWHWDEKNCLIAWFSLTIHPDRWH